MCVSAKTDDHSYVQVFCGQSRVISPSFPFLLLSMQQQHALPHLIHITHITQLMVIILYGLHFTTSYVNMGYIKCIQKVILTHTHISLFSFCVQVLFMGRKIIVQCCKCGLRNITQTFFIKYYLHSDFVNFSFFRADVIFTLYLFDQS